MTTSTKPYLGEDEVEYMDHSSTDTLLMGEKCIANSNHLQ